MGAAAISIFIIFIAIAAHFIHNEMSNNLPVRINGEVDDRFKAVRVAFRNNFESNWESEGASLAVYYDGQKVIDLWGGSKNSNTAEEWTRDTISITFSTTKAVAAVCIAMLVERGRLRYDDLISNHWPGWAKHGKGNVTIQMALSHMAGIPYIDTPITLSMAADHEIMRQILEDEVPKYPPGTQSMYHPYTYGWIVDQIIRHTDEQKRGIGQFLREEITQPNDHRVAPLSAPNIIQRASEVFHDYSSMAAYVSMQWELMRATPLSRALDNPAFLKSVSSGLLNHPDIYRLEQAGALGIGNARSLAAIFNLVVQEKLISRQGLDRLQKCHVNESDVILGGVVAKGHGFFHLPVGRAGTKFALGHPGHGCQQVIFDLKNRLVIAYVTNGLKTFMYDKCRTYMRLQNSVYDVIERLRK